MSETYTHTDTNEYGYDARTATPAVNAAHRAVAVNGTQQTYVNPGYVHDSVDGYTISPNVGILGLRIAYWASASVATQAEARARHGDSGAAIAAAARTVDVRLNSRTRLYDAGGGEYHRTLTVQGSGFAPAGTDTYIEDNVNPYNNPRAKFDPTTDMLHVTFKLHVDSLGGTGASDVDDTGTLFAKFERGAWKFVGVSIPGAAPTAAGNFQITHVYLDGTIETTQNRKATHVGFDVEKRNISIGTGEHVEASLPLEWLQDLMAMHNIDGTLQVTGLISDVIAQKVDVEAFEFVQDYFNEFHSELEVNGLDGDTVERTFDVHPPARFNGNTQEWIHWELPRSQELPVW